jgi:uncharacterized protein (DUF2236 family)
MKQLRDIAGEGVMLLAGGRSVLLQLADPAIGHGVAHHSDFATRPLDRLAGTLSYAYAVTCGTPEQARAAVRRVNRAHVPVIGPAVGDAPAYSAFTPELQLWVAATLYDSAVGMHERIFGPFDDATAESLYREYAVLGTALQVPEALWPSDRAAFAVYWRERLAGLRTDETTRAVARQLLHPSSGPLLIRLVMPLARLVTVGLLPAAVRDLFELPWTPRQQRRFDRMMRLTTRVYPLLPGRLRRWPRDHYLGSVGRPSVPVPVR